MRAPPATAPPRARQPTLTQGLHRPRTALAAALAAAALALAALAALAPRGTVVVLVVRRPPQLERTAAAVVRGGARAPPAPEAARGARAAVAQRRRRAVGREQRHAARQLRGSEAAFVGVVVGVLRAVALGARHLVRVRVRVSLTLTLTLTLILTLTLTLGLTLEPDMYEAEVRAGPAPLLPPLPPLLWARPSSKARMSSSS